MARKKIKKFPKSFKPKFLVLDVDGVFTDGKFYYTADGKVMKKYGDADSDALSLIRDKLEIHTISGDKRGFPITKKRMTDMKVPCSLVSTFERVDWVKKHFDPKKTIYMGDGIYEPLVFKEVAYSIAPANAFYTTKQQADYVTKARGSECAVAEAVLHILEKFFREPFDVHKIKIKESGAWKKGETKTKIKYIKRNQSVITGQVNLEPLYTFEDFPVFFGCVKHSPQKDLKADMSWAICPKTGVIQLDKLIPLDILYQAQHVDGTGPTWAKYYQDFARYIKNKRTKNIFEIGGGAGDLAKIFTRMTRIANWTIIEPNPLIKSRGRIKVIPAFFDKNFSVKEKPDAVVFSQVLEHAYNPQEFIQNIASFLEPGKKLIFAYPNLKLWLKRKYTNAINFEHTMFLTDYWVDYLLKKYGFAIADKTIYKDHSYFYTAIKLEKSRKVKLPKSKYRKYKKIFNNFIKYHQDLVKKLNQQIDDFEGEVYLFGAHIFSQYLLEFGLNKDRIKTLLDNSKLKQGKRLYGTKLKVFSPQILKGKDKIGVVLKVGIYRDEILKQLKKINPQVKIFE